MIKLINTIIEQAEELKAMIESPISKEELEKMEKFDKEIGLTEDVVPAEAKEECPQCNGDGTINLSTSETEFESDSCDECEGRGWLIKED